MLFSMLCVSLHINLILDDAMPTTGISLGQVYPEIAMLTFHSIQKSIFLSVWGWYRKST